MLKLNLRYTTNGYATTAQSLQINCILMQPENGKQRKKSIQKRSSVAVVARIKSPVEAPCQNQSDARPITLRNFAVLHSGCTVNVTGLDQGCKLARHFRFLTVGKKKNLDRTAR